MALKTDSLRSMLGEEPTKNAEYYLSCIGNWVDPNPAPIIEEFEGIKVVRDDLLGAGTKIRFIDYLIKNNPDVKEWVYGSSPRWGYGQISLSYVCSQYGKQCVLFLAESTELHPNSQRAKEYGAKIFMVPVGFMKVCEARAKEYLTKTEGAVMVPFGLVHDTIYGSMIKVARNLPFVPDVVVTVAGSGTLNRGLQMAWPKAKCHMVAVGHNLTDEEIGRATMNRHPLKFQQHCKKTERPPFPSVLEYDAKAWTTALQLKKENPSKTVLFWNVGA